MCVREIRGPTVTHGSRILCVVVNSPKLNIYIERTVSLCTTRSRQERSGIPYKTKQKTKKLMYTQYTIVIW